MTEGYEFNFSYVEVDFGFIRTTTNYPISFTHNCSPYLVRREDFKLYP